MTDLAETMPEAPDADWADAQIGRYKMRRLVGTGGMGVVVAAHDPELDREVAIKIVSGDEAARPIREAQAMAKLSHPNVVQVYEVVRLGARTAIVMELVAGEELGAWVKDRPWREIVDAYAQACRGLAAAHRVDIVHRDFKPSNALVDKDGVVRVTDFGLAHASKDTPLDSAGTPAYMAPEQHRRGDVDARTDQWSVACSLYEALYGRRPFEGSTRSELAASVTRGEIAAEPASSPVPRRVRAAIRRALSLDPDDRFESIESFATAITWTPRTMRYVVAGGVLALVALVIALAMSNRSEDAVCDDLDAPMRTLWTADARAALRTRLLAPNLGLSEASVDTALGGLDAFATSWIDARVAACTDTQRGVRSADTLDGRMRCLDRRHAELAGLLEALGAGGPDALRRTNDAVVQLRPPASCAEAIDDTRPTNPVVQAELDAGENLLSRAIAASSVWQFERASSLVDQAVAAADRVESPSLLARALVVRGETQDRLGRSDDALATFQRAAKVAAHAREPAGVAEAMSRAFLVEGDHIGRRADALRNRPFIELAVELAGQPDALRAAWLHHLAIILYEDPAEVEEAARSETEALAIRRRILPASHPYIYDSMETLANVEIERKNFDHARQLLVQVLEARKASRGPRALSAVYTNLGVLEASRGNLLDALEWQQAAYDVSVANGKQNLHALFNLAGIHFNLGRARLAAKTFEQCFEVYQRRHKESRDVADSLAFLGISWIHAGEIEKGRPFLLRGIEMGRTQGSPTHSVNLTYAAQLALVDRDRPRAKVLLEEATKPSIANPALHGLVKAELIRDEAGCAAARPLLAKALEQAIADSERWVQTMATIDLASCDAEARPRLEAELAWLVKVGADDLIRARVQAVLAKAR
jgi:tetratricopeptide (TPR) repeat protein